MTPTEDFRPDGAPPHDDGATADALRQVLAAEAADVHPSPDALQTIRMRLASSSTGEGGATALGGGTAPARRSWMLGALGAAAATVTIIGGVVYIGQQGGPSGGPESGGPAAGGPTEAHSTSASQTLLSPSPRVRHRFPGPPSAPSQPTASVEPSLQPSVQSSQPPTPSATSPQGTSPSSHGRRPLVLLTSPREGSTVSSPVTVKGTANVFEGNVSWKLLSGYKRLLREGHANAGFMQWKPFSIHLGRLKPGLYTVVAYEASPRNGNPTHVFELSFTVR